MIEHVQVDLGLGERAFDGNLQRLTREHASVRSTPKIFGLIGTSAMIATVSSSPTEPCVVMGVAPTLKVSPR